MDEVTALIVAVPDADPLVGPFRDRLDSGAALGVPAHVTILYPFMPTDLLDDAVIRELHEVFSPVDPFDFSLGSIGWFDEDVVYLRPEPDGMLRQLIKRVVERWPQWQPYEGAHGEPTPHLTIGDNGDHGALEQAAHEVRRGLPLDVEVTEVELYAGSGEPGSWHRLHTVPLRSGG